MSFCWGAFDIKWMVGGKLSQQVWVGLQVMGSEHMALALPM
jgi:hypothetical protein